jgi:predicted anti-sigma-YlaC factor YlaD
MTELNCESVSMAAMALADGYHSEVSAEQIEAHLDNCADCLQELGQLRALATLLAGQKRQQQQSEHIWAAIGGRLPGAPQKASRTWRPFALLGLLLLAYKLVEMIPDRDFGLLFKVAPILFVVAAFGYLKENPFKINAELRLEDGE